MKEKQFNHIIKKLAFSVILVSLFAILQVNPIYAQCRIDSGTISSNCTWSNNFGTKADMDTGTATDHTVRGVLEESGGSNTSTITIASGATVTINALDTIIVGQIDLSGDSGQIAIIEGGELKPGSILWYSSTACDSNPVVSKSTPTNDTYSSHCSDCSPGAWECNGSCQRQRESSGCSSDMEYENAPAGDYCSSGSFVSGRCGYGSWSCEDNSCQRSRPVYTCNGSNSCSQVSFTEWDYISSGKICSGGSEVSGSCGSGSWGCSNNCTRSRDLYACNGSGTCNSYVNDDLDYCSTFEVCSSGSCIKGDCNPFNSDYYCDGETCTSGSCCPEKDKPYCFNLTCCNEATCEWFCSNDAVCPAIE